MRESPCLRLLRGEPVVSRPCPTCGPRKPRRRSPARKSHWAASTGLNEALQTRKVIGEAIGILMERHAMTEDSAFAFLVQSFLPRERRELRAVAHKLVNQRSNTYGVDGARKLVGFGA